MNKFSINPKLNNALSRIAEDLNEYGIDEVKRYMREFPRESDYNIAQYGNLLVYYSDIYAFYRSCGYKSLDSFSTSKIWELYKHQVGYVARIIAK